MLFNEHLKHGHFRLHNLKQFNFSKAFKNGGIFNELVY